MTWLASGPHARLEKLDLSIRQVHNHSIHFTISLERSTPYNNLRFSDQGHLNAAKRASLLDAINAEYAVIPEDQALAFTVEHKLSLEEHLLKTTIAKFAESDASLRHSVGEIAKRLGEQLDEHERKFRERVEREYARLQAEDETRKRRADEEAARARDEHEQEMARLREERERLEAEKKKWNDNESRRVRRDLLDKMQELLSEPADEAENLKTAAAPAAPAAPAAAQLTPTPTARPEPATVRRNPTPPPAAPADTPPLEPDPAPDPDRSQPPNPPPSSKAPAAAAPAAAAPAPASPAAAAALDASVQLKGRPSKRAGRAFSLSAATNKKAAPVQMACFFMALLAIGGILASGYQVLFRDTGPMWHHILPLTSSVVILASTAVYYIRWSDSWLRRHADLEIRSQLLRQDMLRASWFAEMLFQYKDERNAPLPESVIQVMTKNLFADQGAAEPARHPVDDLAGFVHRINRLRMGGSEIEMEAKPDKKAKE